MSIGFVFIRYEWLHTLDLCVNDSRSDIIHSLSLSLALSLHSNCWFVVFISLILSTTTKGGSERRQAKQWRKKATRIVELIFQDNRHTCYYFNKPKACDSQLKFVFIDIRRAHYHYHLHFQYWMECFYDAHFIASFLFSKSSKKQSPQMNNFDSEFSVRTTARVCSLFDDTSLALLPLFVFTVDIELFVPFNILMIVSFHNCDRTLRYRL